MCYTVTHGDGLRPRSAFEDQRFVERSRSRANVRDRKPRSSRGRIASAHGAAQQENARSRGLDPCATQVEDGFRTYPRRGSLLSRLYFDAAYVAKCYLNEVDAAAVRAIARKSEALYTS